jgi:hypothetical protein
MFAPEVEAIIPDWTAKKQAQWDAVKDALPGLQLVVSGLAGTQYMLTCSALDGSFYESIVFGQLPQIVLEEYGSKFNRRYRDMPEDKKSIDARAIDLSDEQIATVLAHWAERKSAVGLPFIAYVVGADGKRRNA